MMGKSGISSKRVLHENSSFVASLQVFTCKNMVTAAEYILFKMTALTSVPYTSISENDLLPCSLLRLVIMEVV